jgi:hypothetical protein
MADALTVNDSVKNVSLRLYRCSPVLSRRLCQHTRTYLCSSRKVGVSPNYMVHKASHCQNHSSQAEFIINNSRRTQLLTIRVFMATLLATISITASIP